MLRALTYIKARLNERSTWMAIAAGVTVASALPWAWNAASIACAVIAALVPDGNITKGSSNAD